MGIRWCAAFLALAVFGCEAASDDDTPPILIDARLDFGTGQGGEGGAGQGGEGGAGQGGEGGAGQGGEGGTGQGGEGGAGQGGEGGAGQGGEGGAGQGGDGQGGEGGAGQGGMGGGQGGMGGEGGVACTPDCADRVCGADGCGGECGTPCADGQVCDAGRCVRGECPGGTFECDGVCSALIDDADNCGSCGEACPRFDGALSQCIDAECYVNCPGLEGVPRDVDFGRDINNCGGCGNVCPAPEGVADCEAGVCTCPLRIQNTDLDGAACRGVCQMKAENCQDGCCPRLSARAIQVGPLADAQRGVVKLSVDAVTDVELTLDDGGRCPDVLVRAYLQLNPDESAFMLAERDRPSGRMTEHVNPGPSLLYRLTYAFQTRDVGCTLQMPLLPQGEYMIRISAREAIGNLEMSAQTSAPEALEGPGIFEARQRRDYWRRVLNVQRDLDAWIYFTAERNECHAVRVFTPAGQLVAEGPACNNDPTLGEPPVIRTMLPRGRYIVETYVADGNHESTLSVLETPPLPEGAITEAGTYSMRQTTESLLFFPEGGDYVIRTRGTSADCQNQQTNLSLSGPDFGARNNDVDLLTECSMVTAQLSPNTGYDLSIRQSGYFMRDYDVIISPLAGQAPPLAGPGQQVVQLERHELEHINLNFPAGGEYTVSTVDSLDRHCLTKTTLTLVQGARQVAIDIDAHRADAFCSRIVYDFEPGVDYVLLVRGRGWHAVEDTLLLIEGDPQPDPEPGPQPDVNPEPLDVIDGPGVYNRPALAAGQEDILEVRVAEEMNVTVRTAGPDDGPCPGDTLMGVALDGELVEINDDGGEMLCSSLLLRFTPDVVPTIHVAGYEGGAVPPYSIVVEE